MGDRRLNFSAPLISARRSSMAKEESEILRRKTYVYIPEDHVTKPAAIPFNWEHVPGLPKGSRSCELPSSASRRTLEILKQRVERKYTVRSSHKILTVVDSYKPSGRVHPNVEDDDAVSNTDGVSAVSSGLSNCDTASGKFANDKNVYEFMMLRFLPAAQAVALQPRKMASVGEERFVAKVVSVGKKMEVANRENEFDDDESLVSVQIPVKSCGLFTRLCFRNPVSFLRCEARPPLPPRGRILKKESKNTEEVAPKAKCERPSMSRTSSPLARSGVLSPRRSRSPQRQNTYSDTECVRPNRALPHYRGGIRSQDMTAHHAMKQWSCPLIPAMEKASSGENPPQTMDSEIKFLRREAATVRTQRSPFEQVNRARISERRSSVSPMKNRRREENDVPIVRANEESCGLVDLPVLPKSPSESWLWRTLPNRSANAESKWEDSNYLEEKRWENIVKSSRASCDRMRYSADLTPRVRKF